jgi:hypothetical protein
MFHLMETNIVPFGIYDDFKPTTEEFQKANRGEQSTITEASFTPNPKIR